MLGEHDQRRPGLVEPRVHAGGDLHAAREGQADVHAVLHLVRGERAADFLGDLLVRRDALECEGEGGRAQAREVLLEREDAAVVEPEAFPDGVAALHRAIERADAGLVAMRRACR